MSDEKPEPSKKPEKKQRGENKRSNSFEEMLELRNFSVPDEACRLFRSISNPFAVYLQQFRAAGMPEQTIEQLTNLVNQNIGYYKRKLECLKILATYSHPKPSKDPGKKPVEEPDKPPTKSPNKYAGMTSEDLIAGLPSTDEHFDSGPTQPGS